MQHFLERWSNLSPFSSDCKIYHVSIEEASPLRPSNADATTRQKASPFKTSYLNAISIVIGVIIIGLSVALVFHLLATWSENHEPERKSDHFHDQFLELGCNWTASHHLRELTREPHVAGTGENFVTAEYVHSVFEKYGLPAHYVDYNVLLSYPVHRSLSLDLPNGSTIEFSLQEAAFDGDPYSKNKKVIPSFLAYSPSGNVSAEVVYANYGREKDFDKLKEIGIEVKGAIVIARYGGIYRGDVVLNSAKAGAVATIIYSDPEEYAANGTQGFYPDSQWLPPSGLQRGSIYEGIGDPLTPGWPSTARAERLPVSDPAAQLPKIPALPISAQDAKSILLALGGPQVPYEWQGSLDLPSYRIGRGPGKLHLSYTENQTVLPIRDVFAVIKGSEEPDRYVILGNHRDAWTFGAVDPNSGTASLLELSQRLSKLLKCGWRPRRTIVLCNWDAEEYGLIGSTEWVEENADLLGARAVAYVNVDCAVAGPGFFASATPQLDSLLKEVTKKVNDPDAAKATIYDSWIAASADTSPIIDRLGGGGSDYAAFIQHAGVPAIDFGFGGDYPVYHSLYDNYNWMEKFGDPLFHRHVAISSVWGLVALHLADDDVLPFDYLNYAHELQKYMKTVEAELRTANAPNYVAVEPLDSAIAQLLDAANDISFEKEALCKTEPKKECAFHGPQKKRSLNDRLMLAERAFLDSDGLPGRSWYKHLVYGPTRNDNYGTTAFPGILDSIANVGGGSAQKWAIVQHEIWRVARVIKRVAVALQGDLT
ncbi:hypothetical protein O6H91_07G017500 [Diphasiastrum complanatum]|uniref:Uncharacterized protein n=2 Tax=Diphasiastrum complanatum TaxID=34168 RepID=A0ACC2D379_DIPCM|nr:hypothetical protein O6H91_07G017500 [Diphasiastrum complanatum]KAJ7548571.1 hypothetical protein O6H91_07G017500 [Diphasiastrum complanatum]